MHLHSSHRIIQVLCDHGADASLTDIEGNTPRDLADKNGQHKCAKYLATALKQKASKASSGIVRVSILCTVLEHLYTHPLNCFKLNKQKDKLVLKNSSYAWSTLYCASLHLPCSKVLLVPGASRVTIVQQRQK